MFLYLYMYLYLCLYLYWYYFKIQIARVENFEKDTIGGFADDDGRNQLQSHWHPACPGPSARAHDDDDVDHDDEVEMMMMMLMTIMRIMQRTSKALRARHPAYT